MIDGIELADVTHVVALGITTDGDEGAAVAPGGVDRERDRRDRAVERSGRPRPAPSEQELYVLDGAKALRKAVRDVAGPRALVQRCQIHKSRNVLRSPTRPGAVVGAREARQGVVRSRPRPRARVAQGARRPARKAHPDAAGSLREGMEETLTLTRLDVTGTLRRTLSSTNCIERMFDTVRTTQRNVKRWRDGDMRLRWTAAGMLEAETRFRKVQGYRGLATSPSRSNATSLVAARVSSTPEPRRTPRHSLCNHDNWDCRHQSSTTHGATSR